MKTTHLYRSMILGSVLASASVVLAQGPVQNINPARHSHLASAQNSIAHAYQKIETAQTDNRDRLGGHAQKAKDLLAEASQELKLAAEYANHHGR